MQQLVQEVDLVLATAAAAHGAPAALVRIRSMISCRMWMAPARRRAAAGARNRRGAGHCGSRARSAGGAGGGVVPAGEPLGEHGGAGQAPCSSWRTCVATVITSEPAQTPRC